MQLSNSFEINIKMKVKVKWCSSMKQKNATNWWMINYSLFTCENFDIESSVMWIFSSGVPSVSLPDGLLLKVRYEYISPPDMLEKKMKIINAKP